MECSYQGSSTGSELLAARRYGQKLLVRESSCLQNQLECHGSSGRMLALSLRTCCAWCKVMLSYGKPSIFEKVQPSLMPSSAACPPAVTNETKIGPGSAESFGCLLPNFIPNGLRKNTFETGFPPSPRNSTSIPVLVGGGFAVCCVGGGFAGCCDSLDFDNFGFPSSL